MPETESEDHARVRALEAWFPEAARDLPWRRERSAWGALVSEIMLQQTQVSRVVSAYLAFLQQFPTPADLACADEASVLEAWEGMGYYRRARMLHAAAKEIVRSHGGRVPDDPAALRALPGVGAYTAGAIASILFGRAEPIVDGNVERVLARWDLRRTAAEPAAQRAAHRESWKRAAQLVGLAGDPGLFNESLMELGATVCTPARPRCEACPVAAWCGAKREGVQGEIPVPRVRAVRTELHLDAAIIRSEAGVLLERRPEGGLWAGLWQLPTLESPGSRAPSWTKVRAWVREVHGAEIEAREPMGTHRALLTHRRVTLRLWRATPVVPSVVSLGRETLEWVRTEDLASRPMSSLLRRAMKASLEGYQSPGRPG